LEWSFKLVTTIVEFKQLRNCFRCGKEFRGESGKRVCPNCAAPKDAKKPLSPTLSFRERQVVQLICKAKLNKEIAYELHLTEGTVKEYLNRIFRKVGASNRTELAVWAITTQSSAPVAVNGGQALLEN
jgi:DNA-binding NarL/FixJ family response regulator